MVGVQCFGSSLANHAAAMLVGDRLSLSRSCCYPYLFMLRLIRAETFVEAVLMLCLWSGRGVGGRLNCDDFEKGEERLLLNCCLTVLMCSLT